MKRLLPFLPGATSPLVLLAACAMLGACGSSNPPAIEDDTGVPIDETGETSPTDTGVDSPVDTGDTAVPPSDPTDRSKCAVDPDKVGLTKREVKSADGSVTWTYSALAPASYDPKKLTPLLIALHGAGDTADNYLTTIWQDNAEKRGFLVLSAEGSSKLGVGYTYSSNDVKFIINQLLVDFSRCYTVDPKQRVIHGFSAGGTLAFLIGFENAAMFSGVSVAGADFNQASILADSDGHKLLPAPWLIPVSEAHGKSDAKFPIESARAGRDKLIAAGHTVGWHEFEGGNTTDAPMALMMWDELATSKAP